MTLRIIMKYFFVYSPKDLAGRNMANYLKELFNFEKEDNFYVYNNFYIVETKIHPIYADFLENIIKDGIILVLSKHTSEKRIKSITAHTPGNWTKFNDYGGKKESVSVANPILQTIFIRKAYENNKFEDFEVTFEVTHHGPSINLPITFFEIGSSEEDWKREDIARFIVDMILDSLKDFEKIIKKENKICLGIGGPHYAPKFTKFVLENKDYFIGHMIPKYVFNEINLNKMIPQGIEKSFPKVNTVLIDKKGVKAHIRERVKEIVTDISIELI